MMKSRSSHPKLFCKKGALRNFVKIHRKKAMSDFLL